MDKKQMSEAELADYYNRTGDLSEFGAPVPSRSRSVAAM